MCVCTLELFIFQAKESTERAISICQRVGKPNEADRKLLNKLYPACSSRSRPSLPQKRKFNPLDHSIAGKNKVKKKAAIPKVCKMRTVTAVLLDHLTSTVPRATARKRLMADGRIKKIQIRRSMNPSVIRQVIVDAFSSITDASKAKFMRSGRDNTLTIIDDQVLSGNDVAEIAGNGSLYLRGGGSSVLLFSFIKRIQSVFRVIINIPGVARMAARPIFLTI